MIAPSPASATRELEVQLLGGLALRLGEAQLPRPESARAESLLAFLILHRDAAQPRQRVAFTLWPDSTEHQARTNLRHVLHNLRRALPEVEPHLEVGQRTLRWQAGPGYRLDVDAFERALRRAAAGEGDEVSVLQEAVEVYRGDLLEGCDDEWLLEERERLRQRYVTVSAPDANALENACGEVEQQAAQARLVLSRVYGDQELAFTPTLPICRGLP